MKPDWFDWLRLEQTPGLGAVAAQRLLRACGLPEKIFASNFEQLARLVPTPTAMALLQPPSGALLDLAKRTEAWCAAGAHHVVTLADLAYPRNLLHIPDPPLLLYVQGRLDLLETPALGVVGSRHATQQGKRDASHFAHSLSQAGLTIVSGLATGIDTAAHEGALAASGATIAVIGNGADLVYPASNKRLSQTIAERACIVSQFVLGTPALAGNFPRRNRLISGLSLGVLVIEAAAQSGSLITARMALEQGRDVFAIPGSIHAPLSKGCHQLIKQGAKLVETAADILLELSLPSADKLPLSGVAASVPRMYVSCRSVPPRPMCSIRTATVAAGNRASGRYPTATLMPRRCCCPRPTAMWAC